MREMTLTGLADWQLKRMVETVRSHLLTLPEFRLYEILLEEKQHNAVRAGGDSKENSEHARRVS